MALLNTAIYERRAGGSNTNGGAFQWTLLRTAALKWTLSAGGTNEYYVDLLGGGDPSTGTINDMFLDGNHNQATQGTAGSLTAGQWDYADNDTLGYSTAYVRLADDTDPDTKPLGYIGMGAGGGYDYTQQAAAQLALTDIATDGAGTGVSSTTGGFTALMVNNHIYLADGGLTPGIYRITAYTDTNNITIDRSAGAGASGGTGNVGGAWYVPLAVHSGANYQAAGATEGEPSIHYMQSGTYTFSETVIYSGQGSSSQFMGFTGYTSVRGDVCEGTDRPLFAMGAYYLQFVNYYIMENFRATGTAAYCWRITGVSKLINCTGLNTGAGDSRVYYVTQSASLINCSGSAPNSTSAVFYLAYFCIVLTDCTAHDSPSASGFYFTAFADSVISNSIAYNCDYGIQITSADRGYIFNSIIDNNTTGLRIQTAGDYVTCLNAVITNNTTGIAGDDYSLVIKGTNLYGNTANYSPTNKIEDKNSTFDNPTYADAANLNFANILQANGYPTTYAGTLTGSNRTQGSVQQSGGAETAYGCIG